MLTVIKSEYCTRCDAVCNQLTSKNIEYESKMINDYSVEKKAELLKMASDMGIYSYPLIYDDKTNTMIGVKNVFKRNI